MYSFSFSEPLDCHVFVVWQKHYSSFYTFVIWYCITQQLFLFSPWNPGTLSGQNTANIEWCSQHSCILSQVTTMFGWKHSHARIYSLSFFCGDVETVRDLFHGMNLAVVVDGLWSMLSRALVVNSPPCNLIWVDIKHLHQVNKNPSPICPSVSATQLSCDDMEIKNLVP